MKRWRYLGLRAGLGLILTAIPAVIWSQDLEYRWVEVENKTKATNANDLKLKFTGKVQDVSFERDDGKTTFAQTSGDTARWNKDQLGESVPPGGVRRIRYGTKEGARLDKTSVETTWTLDDDPIDNSMASLGQAPQVTLDGVGNVFAQFTNPEPFDIVYSSIQLFANNDLVHFTIGEFDTPTGTLVGGLPTSFTLAPLASQTLAFGPVSPISYQLVNADIASVAEPDVKFSVGTAAVPEPSTWLLATLAALGCVTIRRRR